MKPKHTQGPWIVGKRVAEPGKIDRILVGREGQPGMVEYTVASIHGYSENADDNARVIAAAPELLSYLKEAVEDCPCTVAERASGHLVRCRAPFWQEAIDKAEGRS